MNATTAPDKITVEFLQANGNPVLLGDLGTAFLIANGVSSQKISSPFRIGIQQKPSKAGNPFYEYTQSSVALPDGLSTFVRVEGVIVPMGRTRPSQNGYPTRDGFAQVVIGGIVYKVTVIITEGKSPFWIKVLAHKVPDNKAALEKARAVPKGGSIIF